MTRPLRSVFVFFVLAALAPPAASADGPSATRANFPDRRFNPLSAADAGLAGAGLAVDPHSSFFANPALALAPERGVRLSANVSNPNRDDLRTSTTDYSDANGFISVSEAGARFRVKGLGMTAYFAQPQYEHMESRFVGIDPQTGSVTGDPFPRDNVVTSATRYGGLGAAFRLKNGLVLGAAVEAVVEKERYLSEPDVPPASIPADTFDVDQAGATIGGAAGATFPIGDLVTLGGAYHFAGSVDYDNDGSDDALSFGILGVKVGRTAGSQGYAGARFQASRDVDLADPVSNLDHAPSRNEYSAGYAYLDPAGTWTFRFGGSVSPRPEGGELKLSRFGTALGLGSEDFRVSIAYQHTSETRDPGRSSSLDLFGVTLEILK